MICPFCKSQIKEGTYRCPNCKRMIALKDLYDIFKPENIDKLDEFIESLKNKKD